jgi:hypothetical protein
VDQSSLDLAVEPADAGVRRHSPRCQHRLDVPVNVRAGQILPRVYQCDLQLPRLRLVLSYRPDGS